MARNSNYILLVIDNKECFDHPQLGCFDVDIFLCSIQYLGTIRDPDECEVSYAE